MGTLSAEASEARRNYQREYNARNRDRINSRRKEWRANNRDKVQKHNRDYWERRAEKARNIRASWEDYGITPERLEELTQIVRSGACDDVALSAIRMADEKAAGHILLSVKNNLSYERIEFHEKLGRCPLGRTDFYGARRLFFHYLDCALKDNRIAENNVSITEKKG